MESSGGGPPPGTAPRPEDLVEIMRLYKQSGGEMDPAKVPEDVRPFVEMFQAIEEEGGLDALGGQSAKDSLFNVMGSDSSGSNTGDSPAAAFLGQDQGGGKKVREITPEAGFVVKSFDDNGRKIFINMCGSDRVPAPGNWEKGKIPEDVAKKLEQAETSPDESLRFPLSLSDASYDLDKQGKQCTTFDCIFNQDVLQQAMANKRLKVFLIELALGWVQEKHHLILDSKYKLPRMKYKGKDIQAQNIRNDEEGEGSGRPIIEEIVDADAERKRIAEENERPASFPLMTTKRKHTVTTKAQALRQNKAAHQSAPPPTTATAADAASDGGDGAELTHTIEFRGKPCESVVVRIGMSGVVRREYEAEMVRVEVVDGDSLEVSFDSEKFPECLVSPSPGNGGAKVGLSLPLPLFVDPAKAGVRIENKTGDLLVELPIKTFDAVAEEMKAAAPHKFGDLKLSDSSFLDLE